MGYLKMRTKLSVGILLACVVTHDSISDVTGNKSEKKMLAVTQLSYVEWEPSIDSYGVTMLVSDRYIRIDEDGEESGYIIYDDKDKTIYSVSHSDKSVLVINEHAFSSEASPVKSFTEYLPLADAPQIAGKNIFNYHVFVKQGDSDTGKNSCMKIQLAENFLPEVSKMLQNYQKVISGQQVKMVDNKVTEMQSPCFYVDQVYNEGSYYEKGLPIQEWHSNDRFKILTSYKSIEIESSKFSISENYKQFSMDNNSKRFLE